MEGEAEEGGYDLNFVSRPPDSLLCLICLSVAKVPWQHVTCGRLFCKSCLEKYQRRQRACPNCREEDRNYFTDKKSHREVLALLVRCEEAESGCDWEGEIQALEDHKSSCPYELVLCPLDCGEIFIRRKLESHLRDDCSERDYDCPHCQQPGTYGERVTSHLRDCPMAPTACPNLECEQEIARSQVQAHVATDCEFTVLPCRYRAHGCGAELPRRDLEAHENDHKLHLEIITKSTQSKIRILEDKIEKLATDNATLQNSVDDLEVFSKGLKCILDTMDNNIKLLTVANESLQSDVKRLTAANRSLENHVKTALPSNVPPKNKGPAENLITFQITEYRKRKKYNKDFYSPTFYTSPKGYHMMINVCLDGYGTGEGTHISVFIYLCEGDHDDTLSWPFVGEISVTLLNQLEDEHHHTRVYNVAPDQKVRAGDNRGWPIYIPQTSLGKIVKTAPFLTGQNKKTQFLKDDSLYFRVSANIPGHKPWLEPTV